MDIATARRIDDIAAAARSIGRPVRLMEVCGTHTVSIFRSGIRSLLPANVGLVSGPGCPVCVTAQRDIDAAIELACREGVIVCTYGDMMRVPGRVGSLERQRAEGADIRVVGSSRAALAVARSSPANEVVMIAVGFETTTPATAAVILEAEREGVENFSVLAVHKLVIPAMSTLLEDDDVQLDGFLCPGHVSVIIGSDAYRTIVDRYNIPCVIAGFEPPSILDGLARLMNQIERTESKLKNAYPTAVTPKGNRVAQRLVDSVFEVADAPWRALGVIPQSGLAVRTEYSHFDALSRFQLTIGEDEDHPACLCGQVIQGKVTPDACTLFGTTCTPLKPYGPCMVSTEGTCSAWFKYNVPRRIPPAPVSESGP